MAMSRARQILAAVFIAGLAFHIAIGVFAFSQRAIYDADVVELFTRVLKIYSVHLGLVFGAIFAAARSTRTVTGSFWLAFTVAILWNLLLGWRGVAFALAATGRLDDSVQDYVAYLEGIPSQSAFLVTGMLAFFFVKKS